MNYLTRRVKTLRACGHPEEAYRILQGTLETCRKSRIPVREIQVLFHYADLLFVDGRIPEAIVQLEYGAELALRERGPQDFLSNRVFQFLGSLHEFEGDRQKADAIYRRVLPFVEKGAAETNRNSVWLAHLALAKSHASTSSERDLEEALTAADEGLKHAVRPIRNTLYLAKAKSLDRLGRTDKAIESLSEGLRQRFYLDLNWIPLERMLFEVLDREKRLDELETEMLRFIDIRRRYFSPQHPAALVAATRYASWLLDQDRASDAEPWMTDCKALAIHPDASDQYKKLAIQVSTKANRETQDDTKERE